MQRFKRILKFLLGTPLTLISLFFIFKFIFTNINQVKTYFENLNFFTFSAGIFFLIMFFLFRSLLWERLLANEGHNIPPDASFYLLSMSELKRYIPGSFLGFAARINSFTTFKIPPRTLVKLIFHESIIFLSASLTISVPGILFLIQKSGLPGSYIYLAFGLFFFLLIFFLILKKSLSKQLIEIINSYKNHFLIMLFAWFLYGLGSLLVFTSVFNLDPYSFWYYISFFSFSWFLGYVVLFAPLGLGVREATTTYLFSFMMPVPLAAALAIMARLSTVVAELAFLILSFVFFKFVKIKLKLEAQIAILYALITSYIAYFSYVSIEKHLNFFTGRFDLGNMDQTVWNTINGRIFELTNPDGTNIISRLAIHADFILIILSPFYLIWESPITLLLIQTIILGLGAYFIFKISTLILKDKNLSLVFSISYLLHPFVQKQNLFDFHAVTLATTFLLAAFYFLLKRKDPLFLLFLILTLLTKESVYIVGFLLGIFAFIKTKNKWWIGFAVLSLFVFYFLVSIAIPWARGSAHFATEYFQDFGNSPYGIAKNILLNPIKTAGLLATFPNLLYVYKLLLPAGFLSIFSPLFLIFAAPDILINLLSRNENLRSINFHYAAIIIPFVYISAIYGAAFLLSLKNKIINKKTLFYLILLSSLFATYEYGTLPGSKNPTVEIYTKHLNERREILKFLKSIPPNLSVSATNNLGAHLSYRRNIYTIPNGMDQADVVAFLLNDSYVQPPLEEQKEYARKIQHDVSRIEVYRIGDFVAFAKRSAAPYIKRP